MKNTIRISGIAFACLFAAVTGLAQNANEAYNNYRKLRHDKEARPSPAYSQQLCDAGTGFIATHTTDTKRLNTIINELLGYGTANLAKDRALRDDWYAKLSQAIADKRRSTNDRGKVAFAALEAAVAEGTTLAMDTLNGQRINEWR